MRRCDEALSAVHDVQFIFLLAPETVPGRVCPAASVEQEGVANANLILIFRTP